MSSNSSNSPPVARQKLPETASTTLNSSHLSNVVESRPRRASLPEEKTASPPTPPLPPTPARRASISSLNGLSSRPTRSRTSSTNHSESTFARDASFTEEEGMDEADNEDGDARNTMAGRASPIESGYRLHEEFPTRQTEKIKFILRIFQI